MSGDFGDYYMASITRDGMGYMQIETPLALAHPVLASITRDGVHADRDTTGVGPSGCTLSGLGSKWTHDGSAKVSMGRCWMETKKKI